MGFPEISHRKVVVNRFGGVDALQVVAARLGAPPPGHVRVKVLAIGVGFTDLMARSGDYLLQRKAPFTPGYELVGEVVDGDSDLAPGTLVAASLPKMGAYTEHVTLPSWVLVPVPAGLDPRAAATLPLDYLTAVSLLDTHGRVRRGDTVLIQGAAGGVGRALSTLGRHKGLTMYGTASGENGAEVLARNGVRFIDFRRQDFEGVLREREPEGLHAVFDHIGGANLGKGYRVLGRGGVLVSYAFSGRPGHMVADTVRGAARVRLLGLRPGKRTALSMVPREANADHTWYRDTLTRVLAMAADGSIRPEVGAEFPLTEAAAAHAALQRREVAGKVVLTTL